MLLKGNPHSSIFNIRLNYFRDFEGTACEGVRGWAELLWAARCQGLPSRASLPAGLAAAPAPWSLSEAACAAGPAQAKPTQTGCRRDGLSRGAKRCRNVGGWPVNSCSDLVPAWFFLLSPQAMLFYFVVAKHLVP